MEARAGNLEEHRNIIWLSRDKLRQAKANLELHVARDLKDKKTFYEYIAGKRKNKKNVAPLLNKRRDLLDRMWLNTFVLGFTSNVTLQESQVPKTRGKRWSEEIAQWKRIGYRMLKQLGHT